jgi:hypothetical protein
VAFERAKDSFFDQSWNLYTSLVAAGCFDGPWWTCWSANSESTAGISQRLLDLKCDSFSVLAHPDTFSETSVKIDLQEVSLQLDEAAKEAACKHIYIWYSLEEGAWLCSLLFGSQNEVALAHNLMVGTLSVSSIEASIASQALDVLQFLRDAAVEKEEEVSQGCEEGTPDIATSRSSTVRFNLGGKLHRLGALDLKHWRFLPFSSLATVGLRCNTVSLAHWRSRDDS